MVETETSVEVVGNKKRRRLSKKERKALKKKNKKGKKKHIEKVERQARKIIKFRKS